MLVVTICLLKGKAFGVSAHSDMFSSLHSPTMTYKWYSSKQKVSAVILEAGMNKPGLTISITLL